MRSPRLAELPPPPPNRTGWPWTEESQPVDAAAQAAWPKITVALPSYQQGRFIEETLRSVLLQGYPDLELIVMDGGSKDETVSIIKKYERFITSWVSERDGGQSAAINTAWRKATGEVVTWINSDDLLARDWARRAASALVVRPEADFVYGDVQVIDGDSKVQWIYPGRTPTIEEMLIFWKMPFAQQGLLMRRSMLETYGYLREDLHFAMDYDIIVRLLSHDRVFVRVEGPVGAFRMHDDAKTTTMHHVHVADMIDVATRFAEAPPAGRAQLAEQVRARLYWNAAHAKYDGRRHAEARSYAIRHFSDAGWKVLPRVSGMIALSFLGDSGHRLLGAIRRLKQAQAA